MNWPSLMVTNWDGGPELRVGIIFIVGVKEIGLHPRPNKMTITPMTRRRLLLMYLQIISSVASSTDSDRVHGKYRYIIVATAE
jgi:hypothetical protein